MSGAQEGFGGFGDGLSTPSVGDLSFNETKWNIDKFYWAAALYFPFFVVFVAFTVHFTTKHRSPQGHCTKTEGGCVKLELKNLLPQLVAGMLSVASLLRIIWCFIEADEYASDPYYNWTGSSTDFPPDPLFYAERILNRLAMLLMLTAFSLVLLGWLLSAGGALADWNKCFRVTFVVVNIVVYIVTLATALTSTESHLYSVNGLIIAAVSVVLGVGYVVIGIKCVGTTLRGMSQSELVAREYRRVLVTAIVCTVCFLLQAVLWILGLTLMRDAWGEVADHIVYPWLFYCLPEIVPGMAIMLLLCFQSRKMRATSTVRTIGVDDTTAPRTWNVVNKSGEHEIAGTPGNETPFLVGALAAAERYSSRFIVEGQPTAAQDEYGNDLYSSINSTQSGSEFS